MAIARQFDRPISINGAGIAGLTTALCLADAGFTIDLHEKAEGFETIGAGIQVSPNAYQVLEKLKIGRQIRKVGTVPDYISVRKASNAKEITKVPLGLQAIKRYGYPYVVIHRADLQDILFQKSIEHPLIRMHFASEVVDFAVHANGITKAVFQEDGIYEAKTRALIIADGVHSKLRTKVMNLEAPVFQDKIAWRALVAAHEVPSGISMDNTTLWLGRGAHAIMYPVRGGKFLNVVAITKAAHARDAWGQEKESIAKNFLKWAPEFRALFQTNASWSGWPVYESQLPQKMAEGPVALIGDAAHAMLPFAAQGAAMSIEDAAILTKHFIAHEDHAIAFSKFERDRIPRVREVMQAARKNGDIYHMSGPQALVRNMFMKTTRPISLLSRQDWIYKWRP